MKSFALGLVLLMAASVVTSAQQLNVGVSVNSSHDRPVVDAVLMAPSIPFNYVKRVIFYGQATVSNTYLKPELYFAAEVPVVDISAIYIGIDNGIGFVPVDNKYSDAAWFIGTTTWVPLNKHFGVYHMLSVNPTRNWSKTISFGLFHQVF